MIYLPDVSGAVRYNVEIEQRLEGGFTPQGTYATETNSVTVELKAGVYRYRFTAWNDMDLPEAESEWQEFTVRFAVEPTLEHYQPFYGFYYELADPQGSITVTGSGFSVESEFALIEHRANFELYTKNTTYVSSENSTDSQLENYKGAHTPAAVTVISENQATLTFNRKNLKRGEYDIFVRNPGGIWTTLGKVRVGFRKNTDFTISLGWAPMIATFDYDNSRFWEGEFNGHRTGEVQDRLDAFNPRGFYIRFGWLPVKSRIGNFGLEFQGNFLVDNEIQYRMNQAEHSNLSALIGFNSALLNLVYQSPPFGRLQYNARVGLGGHGIHNDYHDHQDTNHPGDYKHDDIPWLLNVGAGAQFFVWKNLYLEAGLSLQYAFRHDHFMIFPEVGLGWQFGRWAEHAEVAEAAKAGEDYSVPVKDIPKSEHIISVGWSPMVHLYGRRERDDGGWDDWSTLPPTWHQNPPKETVAPFSPGGAYFRYAYIPYFWRANKLGFELDMSILDYSARKDDMESEGPYVMLSYALFGALYQRVLTERLQLNVRAGLGISHPYAYGDVSPAPAFALSAGASVQFFFWRNLFLDAGMQFIFAHVLAAEGGDFGMLRPTLGIGWQFNRDTETGLRLKRSGLPRFDKSPEAP